MDKKDKSESIAYHEAGHAVIAIKLNVPVEYSSIIPTDEYDGATKYKKVSYSSIEEMAVYINNKIIVMLSGAIAAEKFKNVESSLCAMNDYNEASKLIEGVYGVEQKDKNLALFLIEARKSVIHYEKKIEAVANELIVKRKLSGEQIERLLTDSNILM